MLYFKKQFNLNCFFSIDDIYKGSITCNTYSKIKTLTLLLLFLPD